MGRPVAKPYIESSKGSLEQDGNHQQRERSMTFIKSPVMVTGKGLGEGKTGTIRHRRRIEQVPLSGHGRRNDTWASAGFDRQTPLMIKMPNPH